MGNAAGLAHARAVLMRAQVLVHRPHVPEQARDDLRVQGRDVVPLAHVVIQIKKPRLGVVEIGNLVGMVAKAFVLRHDGQFPRPRPHGLQDWLAK